MKRFFVLVSLLIASFAYRATPAMAQSTEDRFHDLFVTAGYATAFGAALGAAALSFRPDPENHLRYIAIGASLGFIGGSVLGSYVVFSPLVVDDAQGARQTLATAPISRQGLTLRPVIGTRDHNLLAFETGFTLFRF